LQEGTSVNLIAAVLVALALHHPAAPRPDVPGSWRITLNASPAALAKWPTFIGPFHTDGELACYSPSNIVPHIVPRPSYLALRVTRVPGTCKNVRRPYTGSMILSHGKFEQKDGLWEARIWFAATRGGTIYDWPAWWVGGGHELDIAECMNGRVYQVAHLPNHPQFISKGVHVTPGWHNYAVRITARKVSWWIDGHQVAHLYSTVFGRAKMFAILDMSVHKPTIWNHPPRRVPTLMKVAWVRAWVRI